MDSFLIVSQQSLVMSSFAYACKELCPIEKVQMGVDNTQKSVVSYQLIQQLC